MALEEKLIFDIGMHNGRDTEFYLKKGFKVVAVEASEAYCNLAREKFSSFVASGQLAICHCAIAPKEEELVFRKYEGHDDWSSVVPDWNESIYQDDFQEERVKGVPLQRIIQEHGCPYYLKIDIEGSDHIALQGLLEIKDRPKYVSVELLSINNLKGKSEVDFLQILCLLRTLGYTKFQIVDQSKHELIKCPNPAIEGKFVDFKFDGYSSGLFGKELPDHWTNIDEVAFQYLIYSGKKQGAHLSFFQKGFRRTVLDRLGHPEIIMESSLDPYAWFDIHATY